MFRHSGQQQVYGISSSKQMRKDLAFFKSWLALFPLISKDHVAFIVKRVKQLTKNFLLGCWTLGDQGNAICRILGTTQ